MSVKILPPQDDLGKGGDVVDLIESRECVESAEITQDIERRREAAEPWEPGTEADQDRPPAADSAGAFVVESAEPLRLAEHFLDKKHRDQQGRPTLRRWRLGWWGYRSGSYHSLEDEALGAEVYSHLDHLCLPTSRRRGGDSAEAVEPLKVNARLVSEVVKALPSRDILVSGDAPQWLVQRQGLPDPRDLIVFRNGILNTAAYCESGAIELLPGTPDYFAAGSCPYDFDPEAQAPTFRRWIIDALQDEQSIALAQEWAGLQLVPDNRWERFLMAVGPPRSGKGVFLTCLGTMLGAEQYATTSFAKLSGRFGLAPLLSRLSAFLPDAHVTRGTDAKGSLEVLKSITGNDPQAIDRKNRDELPRVHLPVRFTIAVNELPELPDDAGALKERLLLLHFGTSFAGREDPTIKSRICAEGPGIALWALEGLKRLRRQGRFTVPQRSAVMIREFEKAVNPMKGFLDECCELGPDHWIEKEMLFKAWKDWAEDRGQVPGSKAQFGQRLINTGLARAAKRGPRGSQFPVYEGVKTCHD